MPKAKPAAPDASPPRNAPSHSTLSAFTVNSAATAGSAHIEHEHEADSEGRGKTDGNRDTGALAHRDEFDGEHAEAQRHMQRECNDDHALGRLEHRRLRHVEERVERVSAVERRRESEKM